MNRRIALAGLALAPALALAGCSQTTVTHDKVEQQLISQWPKDKGTPSKASCPDLKAKQGESVECKVTVNGSEKKVKVTVTSVNGNTVNFDFKEE